MKQLGPAWFIPRAMELKCDENGCNAQLEMTCHVGDVMTPTDLRVPRVAQAMGWTKIGDKLYCPECAKAKNV